MTVEEYNGITIIRNKIIPPSAWKFINLLGVLWTHMNTKITEANANHEYTHTLEMQELGYIGFYVLYILNFIVNFLYYWNWKKSYKMVIFEIEANMHEDESSYNANRSHYAEFCYINKIFSYDEVYAA